MYNKQAYLDYIAEWTKATRDTPKFYKGRNNYRFVLKPTAYSTPLWYATMPDY